MKRGRLTASVALAAACYIGVGQGVTVVQDGEPKARITVCAEASDQVRNAARILSEYVERASGAKLAVVTVDQARPGEPTIMIATARDVVVGEGLDEDGFVILAQDDEIAICGPTDWGTEFGVYSFLERYVGVRWLLPGPDGDDVPEVGTITVPDGMVRDEPAFFSRLFSGLSGPSQAKWARFNRMHGRVKFHHYLLHVLPPETYTETHPEFFPMKDGKARYLPEKGAHGWQPCFSETGTVDEAIKNIVAYLETNPEETSVSLGVNDSSGHCRCPRCTERLPAEANFLGRPDYSDLYYEWCNKVIEGVLKVHPGTWFGCLAYSEVASPPRNVKVHPRMIPYMTYDRMKWIHPEVRESGHAATEAWQKMSPTLGWYDYIYGTPYCLPRVYFHQTQEYLRYGHAHGVRALYAEIYPNWGEGPKPYVYLKLWWDPQQDVDALLEEWYGRCVGPVAAPLLAAYYGIWERFWTKDILDSSWFSTRGQYLAFSSPGYLADVREEDVRESRRLLEACIEACQTDKQRARAKLLEAAFQYYEASALAYLADRKIPSSIDSEGEAVLALAQADQAMHFARKRRHLALEVFPKHPVLLNPLSITRFPALSGETWGTGGMWGAMELVMRGENVVRTRVMELASQSESQHVRDQASLMLAVADGEISPISANPSFEEGEGQASAGWSYWVKPDPHTKKAVGRMLRVEDVAHTGGASLLCDGMYRGGPVHTIRPLPPGKCCALAWVYVPKGQVGTGTCELVLTPRGDDGNNLPGLSTKITPRPGEWTLIVAGGRIERTIKGTEVTHALLIPIVDGFADGGKVYWDDVGTYRIVDPE